MKSADLSIIIDGVIGLAIIAGAIVLLALSKIDSTSAIALIGAGVAVVRGSTTAALALKVPAPEQTAASPTQQQGA